MSTKAKNNSASTAAALKFKSKMELLRGRRTGNPVQAPITLNPESRNIIDKIQSANGKSALEQQRIAVDIKDDLINLFRGLSDAQMEERRLHILAHLPPNNESLATINFFFSQAKNELRKSSSLRQERKNEPFKPSYQPKTVHIPELQKRERKDDLSFTKASNDSTNNQVWDEITQSFRQKLSF